MIERRLAALTHAVEAAQKLSKQLDMSYEIRKIGMASSSCAGFPFLAAGALGAIKQFFAFLHQQGLGCEPAAVPEMWQFNAMKFLVHQLHGDSIFIRTAFHPVEGNQALRLLLRIPQLLPWTS